jgi:hypothetical protein
MKTFSFFFEPTQQWLNYGQIWNGGNGGSSGGVNGGSGEIGLYRGKRSDESDWEIHEVQNCEYILRHVKTGATFENLYYMKDKDGYKISIIQQNNSSGYQQRLGLVLDTEAYSNPNADSIIFWTPSENPINTNQKWKIFVNTDIVQLYNIDANAYLTISGNKFVTKNNADNSVNWIIKDNVFLHITSRLQHKSLSIKFVTPLDFHIVSADGRHLIADNGSITYTHDYQKYQMWRLLPAETSSTQQLLVRQPPPVQQPSFTQQFPPVQQPSFTQQKPQSTTYTLYKQQSNQPNQSTVISQVNKPQTLNVLTINVQAYESVGGNTDMIASRINLLQRELDDIDVICVQEDLANLTMMIENFTRIATCGAENINDDILTNSIWVNNSLVGMVKILPEVEITSGCKVPRCVSSISIKGIRIANTHLCGGRFDDPYFNDLLGVKENEITTLIRNVDPDIIVGDFNAGYDPERVQKSLAQYNLYRGLSANDKINFLRFYSSMHDTIRSYGYIPAYDEETIAKTSIYGGLPDWIYFLPDKVHVSSAQLVEFTTPVQLSDHDGVYVKFLIV